MTKKSAKTDLPALCGELALSLGLELVDVAFEKEPVGLYLRVYLDSPKGISLNDCEAYHRKLLPLVEELEYDFLEVSSPGIDRPIKRESEARKAIGSKAEIKLFKPLDGQKVYTGIFKGLDSQGYHLNIQGQDKVFPTALVAVARRTLDVDEAMEDCLEQAQEDQA
jgi:ribosome maturation factor RimP